MKIMKIIITFLILIYFFPCKAQDLQTPYERNKLTTTTYEECIEFYNELEKKYENIKILEYGETDIGEPLHLVIVSKDKFFTPADVKKSGKIVVLINNGIHAGEPDGIDATMMFIRNLLENKVMNRFSALPYDNLLDNIVLITIPIYNVGGFKNRNNFSRVNQIGPLEYGFRGNAQNRDLNRDFIKLDTKNAMSFVKIFQDWKPELFIDTHTTDGADYPYKMTFIATQRNKLEQPLRDYMVKELVPFLEEDMRKKEFEMSPYVTTMKSTPDSGIVEFMESGKYSSGYASLFNCISFISESHMLKTHQERVEATYEFLLSLLKKANIDFKIIKSNKEKADEFVNNKNTYVLQWKLDEENPSKISFNGYEAKYKKSSISGFDRLFYDKNSPYEKEIFFYNNYIPTIIVEKPLAYIVPQGWWNVIERLKLNGVEMKRLKSDTLLEVESYYIENFDTRTPPFEGHYLHSNVELRKVNQKRKFFKGDYIIYTNQPANNFIIQVLEPQATDSYFNWNFFDATLQQKEYFDPYLFEDIADSLLNSKQSLKEQFEEMKLTDEKFRNDGYAQLKFIYDNTILEPEFMRYPVARLIKE